MQNDISNQRRNHRFQVGDIGYRASIDIGHRIFDCLVLDFSATGIQIEAPRSVEIPNEGTLVYGDQDYHYIVKHERLDDRSKRLGLELSPVSLDETSFSHRSTKTNRELQANTSSPGIWNFSVWDWSFWVAACAGLCVVWTMFLQGKSGIDHRDVDSFWTEMAANKIQAATSRQKTPKGPVAPATVSKSTTTSTAPLSPARLASLKRANESVQKARECFKSSDFEAVLAACDQAILDHSLLAECLALARRRHGEAGAY